MSVQQIIFLLVFLAVAAVAVRLYGRVRRNILLGGPLQGETGGSVGLSNMTLIAFGQKKMFKRIIPAVLHLFVYVAFLFTQIELIEIIVDGATGQHRVFASSLGGFYTFIISTIEVLSFLALIATFAFLYRRNIGKLARFQKPEMEGWPKLDANLILLAEIALIIGITCMNGADVVLQGIDPEYYPSTGNLAISSWLGPALFGGLSEGALVAVERFGWWLHLGVVFGFILYLPMSKHLHIFLAFFNTYFARQKSRGEMDNMSAIMTEVKSMMDPDAAFADAPMDEEIPEFGAKDVMGLSWQDTLGAYTCTECGRCTDECPANKTGKKLSPRKIMMDIRDRAEEIGQKIDSGDTQYCIDADKPLTKDNFEDGKSLFDYISREELHACTTCNACVEACPVMINPLEPILALRRYELLTESAGPGDWLPMFNAIENTGAVWSMPTARDAWTAEME